jgi:hypothetical protein
MTIYKHGAPPKKAAQRRIYSSLRGALALFRGVARDMNDSSGAGNH